MSVLLTGAAAVTAALYHLGPKRATILGAVVTSPMYASDATCYVTGYLCNNPQFNPNSAALVPHQPATEPFLRDRAYRYGMDLLKFPFTVASEAAGEVMTDAALDGAEAAGGRVIARATGYLQNAGILNSQGRLSGGSLTRTVINMSGKPTATAGTQSTGHQDVMDYIFSGIRSVFTPTVQAQPSQTGIDGKLLLPSGNEVPLNTDSETEVPAPGSLLPSAGTITAYALPIVTGTLGAADLYKAYEAGLDTKHGQELALRGGVLSTVAVVSAVGLYAMGMYS